MRPPCSSPCLALLLAVACGPQVSATTTDGQTDDGATEGTPPATTTSVGQDTTSVADGSGSGSTSSDFLTPSDMGQYPGYECDLYAQNCPPGEKCMPYAADGGSTWNGTRCSPVSDDPGAPGDPCTVQGMPTSGVDTCEIAAMCWNVDSETGEGTCVALCTGDPVDPHCEDPDAVCATSAEGVLIPCLPSCDPLAQDCDEGEACYAILRGWVCASDASAEMGAYGDPCQFINVCDPGLVCASETDVPGCEGSSGACCTDICDLNDPVCTGAAEGQQCLPWMDLDEVPPGYEGVGICGLP